MPPRPALPPGRFESTGARLEPKKARRGGLENPFAETRRPYQIWGVPTQKVEAPHILNINPRKEVKGNEEKDEPGGFG